jgi:hypothetical protein
MTTKKRMGLFVKGLRTRMRSRYIKDHICSMVEPCFNGSSELPPIWDRYRHTWANCRHAMPHSKVDCQYLPGGDKCCGFSYGALGELAHKRIHCMKIKPNKEDKKC